MDELSSRRLSPTGNSSNVELTKSNKHSNEVELDPLTGATKSSDYNRRLTERIQSDVEKLQDGSIHRHRYKLHESNENKTNQSSSNISGDDKASKNLSRLSSDLASSSRLSGDLPSSSRLSSSSRLPSNSTPSGYSSRLRRLLDDDDDDIGLSNRSRIRDYDPLGARLASEVGVDVRSKPISFNYEQAAKRRSHEALLREIDDEDEKFRTLPPTDPFRYRGEFHRFASFMIATWLLQPVCIPLNECRTSTETTFLFFFCFV